MKAFPRLILLFAVLLSGCVNLKPKADRTRIFTLAANVSIANDVEGLPQLYVTRVEVPGFLEGTRIHYLAAGGELESSAGARWANALVEALPRAIATHLQATGRAHVRAFYPWPNTSDEAARLSIQFERFSANADGQVEIIAQWQIVTVDGQHTQGRYIASKLQWDGKNTATYVARLDAGLAGLAESIARNL